jgi:hypothetical protein
MSDRARTTPLSNGRGVGGEGSLAKRALAGNSLQKIRNQIKLAT